MGNPNRSHKQTNFYNTVYKNQQGYSAPENDDVIFKKRMAEISPYLNCDGVCLDLGSGRGIMSQASSNYIGVDLSLFALTQKSFCGVVASIDNLPFEKQSIDQIFSFHTLEHVENVEQVLCEIDRVLKPGGTVFLKPAWNCRSWNNKKLPTKPYSILSWQEKIEKASIPFRNSIIFRALTTLPRRLFYDLLYTFSLLPYKLRVKRLQPNYSYDEFWISDADAIVSIDPHQVVWFFRSRGYFAVSHPNLLSRIFMRSEGVACRKIPFSNNEKDK